MNALALAAGVGGGLLHVTGALVVLFFVALHTALAMQLIAALPELWRHWELEDEPALRLVLSSEALPTVSVVVTGVATASGTEAILHSLLALRYPRHEVVLVHDGAATGGLAALIAAFDLYQVPPAVLVNVPTGVVRSYYRSRRHGKLFVIDKAYVDLADDLNAALNASRFPYILTVDAGSRLEPDALSRLMRPFLLGHRLAAVAGAVRVDRRNATSGWLGGVQEVEAIRDNAFARLGLNKLGGPLSTHGGVLLHRRDLLLEIDGYRGGTADPEFDLVVRLRAHLRAQRLADTIPLIPDAVAWTPAPVSARSMGRQRTLARRGELDVLRTRGGTIFSTRHGLARLLAPIHLAAVIVLAPVLELAGYLILAALLVTRGAGDPLVPLFLLAVPGFALLLSLWAIVLEAGVRPFDSRRDVLRVSAFAVAEQLGFRQWILWNLIRATWSALRGGPSGNLDLPVAATGTAGAIPEGRGVRAR